MFGFHHVALSVSDMDHSKQFYSVFGFKPALDWVSDSKDLTISHLVLGSTVLELFCYEGSKQSNEMSLEDDLRKVGVKHFGLRVDSIEAAKDKVVKANLAEEDIKIKSGRTGITYFFIKDPDDNFVEIVEDKRGFVKTLHD